MSKPFLTAAAVAATLVALPALAQQAPSAQRSPPAASPSTSAPAQETRLPAASRTFVTEGIQGNLAEVRMGQLAQEKGQSQDVRAFGQMLATDHGEANEKLMQIAARTCYLHATLAAALPPQVRIVLNGSTI